jgi:hypothetical protein
MSPVMKNITLLINLVTEYFHDVVGRFRHRKQKPTLVALGIDVFTNESWVEGIYRQGRIMEHLYYYNEQN